MQGVTIFDSVLTFGEPGRRQAMVISNYGQKPISGNMAKFISEGLRSQELADLEKLRSNLKAQP